METTNNTPDQNALAYELCNELQDATGKFAQKHPEINMNGVMGAANCYLATWHTNAPSKAEALSTLEQNFNIIRQIVESTPEAFFAHLQNPNLN